MTSTASDTNVQPLWTLRVPEPSGGWLTANARLHHLARSRRTKVLRRLGYLLGRQNRCPHLQRAHLVLVFHFATARRRDAGNLAPTAKALVDGLVDAGLLEDDDDTRLIGPDLRTGTPAGRGASWVDVLVYDTPARSVVLR